MLRHEDILALRRAIVQVRLEGSRRSLLAGLPPDFVATLPTTGVPGEQTLCDLDSLSSAGTLADGTVPLLMWLQNASDCAGGRAEGEIFARMRESLLRSEPRPPFTLRRTDKHSRGRLTSLMVAACVLIALSIEGFLLMVRTSQPIQAFNAASLWTMIVGTVDPSMDLSGTWDYECRKSDGTYAHGGIATIEMQQPTLFGLGLKMWGLRKWEWRAQKAPEMVDVKYSWETSWAALTASSDIRYEYSTKTDKGTVQGYGSAKVTPRKTTDGRPSNFRGQFYQQTPFEPMDGTCDFSAF